MKKIGGASNLADLVARHSQRASRCYHGHIRIAEPILARAQLDGRGPFVAERQNEFLVEPVEADVIVEHEARVVTEDFLHATPLELDVLIGVVVDPRFVDEEWMMRDR